MKRRIRIMMIEDHPEYREIVEMALNREPDLELVSQFGTCERALRGLRELHEDEKPDIVLLDLQLPGMSGLDAIRHFHAEIPEGKIIILTQSNREENVLKAIRLGAAGYLLKSSTVGQLTEGIRAVMDGGASLDAKLAKFMLDTLKSKLKPMEIDGLLSKREMEVLTMLAEGCVKKEIAERLRISLTTVVSHVGHIYEKLEAPNAPSAIAKAFQLGILPRSKPEDAAADFGRPRGR
jgi:two-component system, NarL family, nitrate/nitrite response regulator NarL